MNRALVPLAWVAAMALLVGCSPLSRVTLLPESDGRATAVEVRSASGVQRLEQPYQTAAVQRGGAVQLGATSAQDVQASHGPLLALQLAPAARFVLQFEPGSSRLTPESQAQLAGIVAQAAARKGGEIVVVGHTDRVGSPQANDALSLQRARAIRELLIERGFTPELIEAAGRGEREPVVPTEPNVDEPRNRRAEIWVR